MNHGKSCCRWDSTISSWETGAGVGAEVGRRSGVGVGVGVAEAASVGEGVAGPISAGVVGGSCVDAGVRRTKGHRPGCIRGLFGDGVGVTWRKGLGADETAGVGVAIAEAVGRGVEYSLCVEVGFVDCCCPDHPGSGGAFVGEEEAMGYTACWVGDSTSGPTGSSAHAVRTRAITTKPVPTLPHDVRSWRNRRKLIRSKSYFGAMGYLKRRLNQFPLVPNRIRIGRDRGDGVCVWRLGQ